MMAILSGGPRGRWAVEELSEHTSVPVDITVFDPDPAGARAATRWHLTGGASHDRINRARTAAGRHGPERVRHPSTGGAPKG